MNHTEETKLVKIPGNAMELLSGQNPGEQLELERFGVAVLDLTDKK